MFISQEMVADADSSQAAARRPVYVPLEAYAPAAIFCAITTIIMTMSLKCVAAAATAWARMYHHVITAVRTAPLLSHDTSMV